MEDLARLYIWPKFKGYTDEVEKTHLVRVIPFTSNVLEQLCLPNVPIWVHNCECVAKCHGECEGMPAGIEQAEYWDQFFDEVTCPTCLRIAREGRKRKSRTPEIRTSAPSQAMPLF